MVRIRPPCQYMVKTLTLIFLRKQESFEVKSRYIAPETQDLASLIFFQTMTLDWPVTSLWQGQTCVPMQLYKIYIENSFSETVLKFNGWNLKCMINVANPYICNSHFVPRGLYVLVFLSLICIHVENGITRNSSTSFHQISHGAFCRRCIVNFFKIVLHHCTRWPLCPYMVKTKVLKILFFIRTEKALLLCHSIWHQGFKVYHVCSNDDPSLTLRPFNGKVKI